MKKITTLISFGLVAISLQSASAGLIALYEFNNSTADSVRGGVGAATVSGTTSYTSGVSGQAFRFNGSTYLTAPLAGAGLSAYTFLLG